MSAPTLTQITETEFEILSKDTKYPNVPVFKVKVTDKKSGASYVNSYMGVEEYYLIKKLQTLYANKKLSEVEIAELLKLIDDLGKKKNMELKDKKFAVVYKDFSFSTENEDMIEQYKAKSNFLAVLPYDFYWNLDKDEMTTNHNERMYAKVLGWIDGYKFANNVR